jgi:hypothetical protein
MDKRLEKALDFSNFRMILLTRQENLKVLMNNKLMLNYGGGLFKVNKELISLIILILMGGGTEAIFIDENDIPIKITELKDFGEKAKEKYEKALEQYYNSYQKLNEAREIRKVIDWDEEDKKE